MVASNTIYMPKEGSNYSKICQDLLKGLPGRTTEVISRRFGLKGGQEETLEAIGKSFGITRERVRQIENDGLKKVKEKLSSYKDVFVFFNNAINKTGNLRKEDVLVSELGGNKLNSQVSFLLNLSEDLKRIPENNAFYACWASDQKALDTAKNILSQVIEGLKSKAKPVSFAEANSFISVKIDPPILSSYLEASKRVQKNYVGLFGLSEWPEINPKGVKDKAYVVLKDKGGPLHFTHVAQMIDQLALGRNKTVPQTVHNELIRDSRFILVGRGMYALKEWGYEPGVVKDVIVKVLREANKPLSKEEIYEKVAKQRIVKENTILLNLNNRNYFSKTQEGLYAIKVQEG